MNEMNALTPTNNNFVVFFNETISGYRRLAFSLGTKVCEKKSEIKRSIFPYFEPKLYVETKSVEQRLKESHSTLLKKELGY